MAGAAKLKRISAQQDAERTVFCVVLNRARAVIRDTMAIWNPDLQR
ncbi:MAG: hypothetical protein LBL16_01395 [Endomicrobium sp.]|jgi:hypothetical protein|nr:hypothetical protein [Endomicrobium sp.]